jgi:enediyne biosynthesis protein E4
VNQFKKRTLGLLSLMIVAGVTAALAVWLIWGNNRFRSGQSTEAGSPGDAPGAGAGAWLQGREDEADKTDWAAEMQAQKYGRVIESFWDSINAATNKFSVIADLTADEIVPGRWDLPRKLAHGISLVESSRTGPVLEGRDWRAFVESFANDGWVLDSIEFRHNRFDPGRNGSNSASQFYLAARLTNPGRKERAEIEGDLEVQWRATTQPEHASIASIKRVDASHLVVKTQRGEPAFRLLWSETIAPPATSPYIDPLMVYDLDGDGLSEIILAAKNIVYRRRPDGAYEQRALCKHPVDGITTAVIADFDGDGFADFLCANRKGLFLFKGSSEGTFDEPGRLVWAADPPLKGAMVLTCADIDHDGALDVFLGQYRTPTLGQVLRPYYYDANDGFPSYLLHNDGKGNLSDITETSGPAKKRWRRIYSASLVDLDADGFPDLLTISDFAGVDLYRNDGHGHFKDVTQGWVAEPHGFGMGHALADFNCDGRLDLLIIGMPSPTVERLEHLGLRRPYSPEDQQRRPAMTFGDRLYLARPEGGFEQTTMNDSIARSGWSWGCSAFDFDNDGFPDVYIANGLQTKESVRDYEGEFWLHDLFVDEKVDDLSATKYLMDKLNRTRGSGWSYGGWEKNRLYLNQEGKRFIEIGHLAGVALEADSRCVVTDDLNGDGRLDLLLTTQEAWPQVKQTLQVYENNLADTGHWIGFHFREQSGRKSPVGVRVTIHYAGRSAVRQLVTGDSHRSQHSNTIHFGLGAADRVARVEITWPDGSAVTLPDPVVDQYHKVCAPADAPGPSAQ